MNGTAVRPARHRSLPIARIVVTLILAVVGLTMLLPFAWMISASMKPEIDVFKFPIEWWPKRFQMAENYRRVWLGDTPFSRYYVNSIKVTVLTTVLALVIGSLGAYGFAKINFKGRDKLFLLVIVAMIIPEQITLLPRFMYFKWIGIFNTHASLVVNSMFSIATVFFIRQYMISIPADYSDSARIDGAGHLRTFWSIIMPMTVPAVATLALLKFIWTWNDYINPLILLSNPKLYTIQIGIKSFADKYGQYYSLIMAASVSGIIPLFVLFVIGQRYILEGITMSGLKG
jgi:multiple sugar transport system permease protein